MKTKNLKMVLYKKPWKAKKWTIKYFEKRFFNGGKNLSQDIDKIVYSP
jgi:hypothetical protein